MALDRKANTEKENGYVVIKSLDPSLYPHLTIETILLSEESHAYEDGKNYAGFILYGLMSDEGVKRKWSLNGKDCQSGYLVIQDTGTEEIKRHKREPAPGQVHGAVYWNVFGKGADVKKAIGEGFSWFEGHFIGNSYSFNAELETPRPIYHDGQKEISDKMGECLQKILCDWRSSPSCIGKTYNVKKIVKDLQLV